MGNKVCPNKTYKRGGRRYYRPEDVKLLKGIKALLYNDGYTIRGVQKVIKENGTKKLLRVDNESKPFTDLANDINDTNDQSKIVKYSINESKEKVNGCFE